MNVSNRPSSLLTRFVLTSAILLMFLPASASVPEDKHWDLQFGPVGVNDSTPFSITALGGNIFVGGFLTAAGNTKANYVAGFNGTNWFPLNGGAGGFGGGTMVGALGTDGVYVYAGGAFTNMDGSAALLVARWDGANWSAMGSGLNGAANVFRASGGNLYVGGAFSAAGLVTVSNIARWDGTNWSALGIGIGGCTGPSCSTSVDAMALQGTNVYVGGNFTTAGGVSANYVARWDGIAWSAMGTEINGRITGLALLGTDLYAGGAFTNGALTNIVRWNGSTWVTLPGGGADLRVNDLVSDGTNLYAGGNFTQIGGVAASGVARWNGSAWQALGSGVRSFDDAPGQIKRMLWHSNQLYVVGTFSSAGNVGVASVARWDGTNWFALGGTISKGISYPLLGNVDSLFVNGTNVFVGGRFNSAGDVQAYNIARLGGSNWFPMGTGVTGAFVGSLTLVRGLAMIGANLYAGGNFTHADGVEAKGLARWNGTNWSPMITDVDGFINVLLVKGSLLYAAGAFTNFEGAYCGGIAVWNQSAWFDVGLGVTGGSRLINALATDGTSIYAGGSFTNAGGNSATNIAKWNGTAWSALGSGMNNTVSALAFGNGLLYAGGTFTSAGGVTANRVAAWNGATWSALGAGLSGTVNDIFIQGANVYVTGTFTTAGGITVSNIAKWDGSQWSALGSGLSGAGTISGNAVAGNTTNVFVGGTFTFAGEKPSMNLARWNTNLNFHPSPTLRLIRHTMQTNKHFRFRVTGTTGERYVIQASTNFSSWTPLHTNSAMFYDFTDTTAPSYTNRYYRAFIE